MPTKKCKVCMELIALSEIFCDKHKEVKTEGLSFQEACAAIGRGEFVQSEADCIYGPNGLYLGFTSWDKGFGNFNIIAAPFRIVSDPTIPNIILEDPSKQAEEKPANMIEIFCCDCKGSTGFCSHAGVGRCGDCTRKLYGGYTFTNNSKYAVYVNPEAKPSLTYEQALECEKVRIHWPESVLSIHNVLDRTNGWDIEELSALDLADRRGYRMEAVE